MQVPGSSRSRSKRADVLNTILGGVPNSDTQYLAVLTVGETEVEAGRPVRRLVGMSRAAAVAGRLREQRLGDESGRKGPG